MPIDTKVVIDCENPHTLARFWAAALGYEVEDNSAFINQLLEAGAVPEEATVVYDGRREFAEAVAVRHPDDPVDERNGVGRGRRILFMQVPEPKVGKNRMHLDLHVGKDAMEAEAARLESLGAKILYRINDPSSNHITMADPELNEFCVA